MDFEIFIIKSLDHIFSEKLDQTIKQELVDHSTTVETTIIGECSTREHTLNHILDLRTSDKDLFILADDIIPVKGWMNVLKENFSRGSIFGFSMLDPGSGLVQNCGYDFVKIDGSLSYLGLHRYSKPTEITLTPYRICDAVTGCCMYVKKEVLSVVTCFPLQGNNRWGELIFSYNAKRKGFNTVVLGHYFKHLAISSKQKNSIKKSSISYLVEKQLWDCVEKELLSDVQVTKIHNTNLDNNLRHLLESSAPLLLYGCGKNTSILFKHLKPKTWEICTSLPEEIGRIFCGKKVLDIKNIKFSSFKNVLITPVGYDNDISALIPADIDCKVYGLILKYLKDKQIMALRTMPNFQTDR